MDNILFIMQIYVLVSVRLLIVLAEGSLISHDGRIDPQKTAAAAAAGGRELNMKFYPEGARYETLHNLVEVRRANIRVFHIHSLSVVRSAAAVVVLRCKSRVSPTILPPHIN